MKISVSKLNQFLLLKLPSAFFSGVRVKHIDSHKCVVTVRHRWINQNPFNSMFWAVQGMAAELSTGALVMLHIQNSNKEIAMLVANNKAKFTKKATGKITFECKEGSLAVKGINDAIATGEGQTFWMKSIGINEQGEQVSEMEFEWSVRVRKI